GGGLGEAQAGSSTPLESPFHAQFRSTSRKVAVTHELRLASPPPNQHTTTGWPHATPPSPISHPLGRLLRDDDTRKAPQPVSPRRKHSRLSREPQRSRSRIIPLPVSITLQLRETLPLRRHRDLRRDFK